ncbi:hypothetical protein BC937DRAFT_91969, partial [Endogone sp. FLAS-F59071]
IPPIIAIVLVIPVVPATPAQPIFQKAGAEGLRFSLTPWETSLERRTVALSQRKGTEIRKTKLE